METPVERAIDFARSLAALAERLAEVDIVVRLLHCNWSSFGSWTVEVYRSDDEAKRSSAIRRHAFSEPGPQVFRMSWDGREHEVEMASTPTTTISMSNQWQGLERRSSDSHESAVALAHEWLIDRLDSSPNS